MRIDEELQPRLPRHVKFRFDAAREAWVLLGPERVLMPDETAVAVLQRCDGATTVTQIAASLADEYDAPPTEIADDVIEMLRHLAAQGLVEA